MELPSDLRLRIQTQFGKMHRDGQIGSVVTAGNYADALCTFVVFLADNSFMLYDIADQNVSFDNLINHVDREISIAFLNQLAINNKSQKWQDMCRHSINHWLTYCLNLIIEGKSKVHSRKKKRLRKISHRYIMIAPNDIKPCAPTAHFVKSYTDEQIEIICQHVNTKNSFSIKLCRVAGIRVHELLSLQPIQLQLPTSKVLTGKKLKAQSLKFFSPENPDIINGRLYSVKGKGGLIRAILIPENLAIELEKKRLKKPKKIRDRKAFIPCSYDISGGNSLSSSFTKASQRQLGWSNGIHALRHDYVKNRINILFTHFNDFELARLVTSQELGHFRPQITNSYYDF